jgi:hypothetical protein
MVLTALDAESVNHAYVVPAKSRALRLTAAADAISVFLDADLFIIISLSCGTNKPAHIENKPHRFFNTADSLFLLVFFFFFQPFIYIFNYFRV